MSSFLTLNTPLGKLRVYHAFHHHQRVNTRSLLSSQIRFYKEFWVHMLSLPSQTLYESTPLRLPGTSVLPNPLHTFLPPFYSHSVAFPRVGYPFKYSPLLDSVIWFLHSTLLQNVEELRPEHSLFFFVRFHVGNLIHSYSFKFLCLILLFLIYSSSQNSCTQLPVHVSNCPPDPFWFLADGLTIGVAR